MSMTNNIKTSVANGTNHATDTNMWNKVLNADTLQKMLFDMGFRDYSVDEIYSIEVFSNTRAGCMMYVKQRCALFTIYVDINLGEPTWELFTDVIYERRKNASMTIIAYSDENYDSDYINCGALAHFFNRCDLKINMIRVENLNDLLCGTQNLMAVEVISNINDEQITDGRLDLPTQQQMQEASFWYGYYWPSFDGFGINDDEELPNEFWNASSAYSLHTDNHCEQELHWTDEGVVIKIKGPAEERFLSYLWENKKHLLKDSFPNCTISLVKDESGNIEIHLKMLDLPISKFVELDSKKKQEYAVFAYETEQECLNIIDDLLTEYHEMDELNQNAS